jgi:hypothetical protein
LASLGLKRKIDLDSNFDSTRFVVIFVATPLPTFTISALVAATATMAAASASLPASSTATADIGRATLQTILDCGDAGYCRNVPRPTVRGSTQLLLTLVVPIITTAFKTLYMHCSRKWWKRALDFAARLLFPEYGLLRVQREEVDRTHFIKVLHDMGFNFATRQQLMAIQEGKLHLSRSSDSCEQ